MAQLTPNDVLRLSEPIEQKYIEVSNKLLINIAKHFNSGKDLPINEWQRKKLAEAEQLMRESASIIANGIKGIDSDMNAAYGEAAEKATADFDVAAQKAVAEGKIDFVPAIGVSLTMKATLDNIKNGTKERLKAVNSTMLDQSVQQYRKAVSNTVLFEANLASKADKPILEKATLDMAAGKETRTKALRKALKSLADSGLTGFVDAAGRKWTPEAYTNMVMRTSVHNTAIQAVRSRAEEYNSQVFMVSAHSGARPLCYPYQNKYYSWDNTAGVIEDGAGRKIKYEPLSSTSYGDPAGLWGVNCQHYPIPVIPNVTIPHEMQEQDLTDNKQQYAESQQQRQYERSIRDAKRRGEMAKAADDSDGVAKASALLKQRQASMRAFINETGRARRYDREKI